MSGAAEFDRLIDGFRRYANLMMVGPPTPPRRRLKKFRKLSRHNPVECEYCNDCRCPRCGMWPAVEVRPVPEGSRRKDFLHMNAGVCDGCAEQFRAEHT